MKYKFSIIIPIYNVEEYLGETVENVINQTIGFEENVQLILVNDGSEDNSKDICLKYKKMYPDNVIYIEQENAGVSAARNNGLKHATGEIINFLDSDDLWDEDAFKKVYNFFSKHDVDVVSCMIEFFEARTGTNHPLNYKFAEGDRIIDILNEPNAVQMSGASCFIKREAIGEIKFDTNLKYAEDAKFINQLILNKKRYGVLKSVRYHYRKRLTHGSALDSGKLKKGYYLNGITDFAKSIIDYTKNKFGCLLSYIQYIVMYDMQWRIKFTIPEGILTSEEKKFYVKGIREVLKNIDDEVIMNQRNISADFKLYALDLKYHNIYNKVKLDDNKLYYKDTQVYSFANKALIHFTNSNIDNNKLSLYGRFNCSIPMKYIKLYYSVNDKIKEIELLDYYPQTGVRNVIEGELFHYLYFNINEKISSNLSIKIYIKFKNSELILTRPSFDVNSKMNNKFVLNYRKHGYMLYADRKTIFCKKYSKMISLKREIKNTLRLIKRMQIKPICIRFIYYLLKAFNHKKIWLITDRPLVANDNAMHLFKYITSINDKEIKPYFAIKKESDDYKKMKEYGKVVSFNSFKYKILFLLSDKVISSQGDSILENAFSGKNIYYRDLYTFDFIFLQHGITKDDISGWLNVYSKNIKLFVTAAKGEYNSIVSNPTYGYGKDVVALTGFPRFDNLIDDKKKLIAIMPTWRNSIAMPSSSDGIRGYNPDFKNSDYFNYYNNLINDSRILKIMKKKGYKGLFVVHPSHLLNARDFTGNEIFEISEGFVDYQTIFREADLLLSDYSSVPFDFAYLYKPVIYTQFDKDEFFNSHTYTEGYFSYEKDGFGPVVNNYEDTVKILIKQIENDCKLESTYKNRIDKFYMYHDSNNCKRVYEAIKKIK